MHIRSSIIALLALAVACSPPAGDSAAAHGASFSRNAARIASADQPSDTVGLRCILHSDSLSARVDSCAVVLANAPTPPAPPAPPPPPAPAPPPAPVPPPPPPVADTVVVSVKVTPNPVTLAAGKSFQLTGGAYNKSNQLIPHAGYWLSADPGKVIVDSTGYITALSATPNTNIEFHYGSKISWSGIVVTGVAPPPPPPTSSALVPADSFSRSVGVGTHFSYFDLAPYSQGANAARTVQMIRDLGVYFVRDGVPYSTDKNWSTIAYTPLISLTSNGVRAIIVTQPKSSGDYLSTSVVDTSIARLGAAKILAFEGPNEVDNNNGNWGGQSAYGANVKSFQCAQYAKAQAAGITMISTTVTSSFGASLMQDQSACADGATLHPYPGGLIPTSSLTGAKAYTSTFAKSKPVWVTETGYHTNLNGTANHYQPGVSELAAAKYITRGYLDFFRAGVVHTSFYEFVDERSSASDDEANFGLVRNDFTPKPAYLALKSLLAAVADPGASFTPAPFTYTLNGATSSVRAVALAKRSGIVELILWNDVSVFDVAGKKDIANAAVPVVVILSTTPKSVTVSYPVTASAKAAIAAAKSFSVSVLDSPVIVEITP